MCKDENLTENIRKAEIRRLIRKVGVKRATAMNKAQYEKEHFVLFHFGQQLAYEECISLIKEIFHDELGEEAFEE